MNARTILRRSGGAVAGARGAEARRGGVYVLVLGVSMMIAVVGLTVIAVSRSEVKSTSGARDWVRAGVMAESAVEAAIARINTLPTWRTDLTGPVEVWNQGTAKAVYELIDEVDGDPKTGAQDSVLVRGLGKAGPSSRRFAVECEYRPPSVLNVLNYTVYGATSVSTQGSVGLSGGGLGTPSLSNSGALTANVRVGTLSNSGSIAGEVVTGASPETTLSDGSLGTLGGRAVTISFGSLASGGEIRDTVLSAAVNPYGATSSIGVYRIVVPTLSRLRIRNCRIAATLIIEMGLLSELSVEGAVHWDRPSGEFPTLVLVSNVASTVNISPATSTLSEALVGVNFNPPLTPYNGASDTDKTDTYPSVIRGVIHTFGLLPTITLGPSLTVEGTVICEGGVTIATGTRISHDPGVLSDPPRMYQTGSAGMSPVAGSWRWEVE